MSLLSRFFVLCVLLIATLHASPIMWAQDAQARLTCRVEPSPLALNEQATLVVEIANIQNLYGYEINMTYDSVRIRVEDADAEKAGINLQLVSSFISPDFVVMNSADNGQIHLALTQLAPNTPKSGSGEVVRTTIVGIGAGFANFVFGAGIFSDANGQALPLTTQDCLVEVGDTGQPTPTATPAPAVTPTSTDFPTHTPTTVSQPPAATFTPVPSAQTATPTTALSPETATATSLPVETSTATATVPAITTPNAIQQPAGPTDLQTKEPQLSQITPNPTPTAETTPPQTSTAQTAEAETSPPAEKDSTDLGRDRPEEVVVLGEDSEPAAMIESSPTATPTPLIIDRVERPTPASVEAVQQPEAAVVPLIKRRLGWLLLVCTSVLAAVAWWLRRA